MIKKRFISGISIVGFLSLPVAMLLEHSKYINYFLSIIKVTVFMLIFGAIGMFIYVCIIRITSSGKNAKGKARK